MAYQKQTWRNLPDRTTPITAERLDHLETQYDEASTDLQEEVSEINSTLDSKASYDYVENRISNAELGTYNLLGALKAPVIVGHRGGASVYPEQSMEGFSACVKDGYPPEMDIRFLADGTPVLCHDSTAERTMLEVSGAISSLTLEQWRKARIKPIMSGGKTAKPVTFERVLDALGGQSVLVVEIKGGATPEGVETCVQMVKDRGLLGSVLFQSFDYPSVTQIIDLGGSCVALCSSSYPASVEQMQEDGVEYVGPSKAMPPSNIQTLISEDFKVIPYTINTPSEAEDLPSGVFGYFSDDPWYASGELQSWSIPGWKEGVRWPAFEIRRNAADPPLDTSGFNLSGGALQYNPDGINTGIRSINLLHLIGRPREKSFYFRATFEFLRTTATGDPGSAGVGFHLLKPNSLPYRDAAVPGQEGYTVQVRRNGEVAIWEYRNGAAAVQMGSTGTGTPLASSGRVSAPVVITFEARDSGWCGFTASNGAYTSYSGSSLTGEFIPWLRINGTETRILDLSVSAR